VIRDETREGGYRVEKGNSDREDELVATK
jgi:hypothetical protein